MAYVASLYVSELYLYVSSAVMQEGYRFMFVRLYVLTCNLLISILLQQL